MDSWDSWDEPAQPAPRAPRGRPGRSFESSSNRDTGNSSWRDGGNRSRGGHSSRGWHDDSSSSHHRGGRGGRGGGGGGGGRGGGGYRDNYDSNRPRQYDNNSRQYSKKEERNAFYEDAGPPMATSTVSDDDWANFDFKKMREQSLVSQTAHWDKYPKLVKNVYKEHPAVAAWAPSEVKRFRAEENGITVQAPSGVTNVDPNAKVPNPIAAFEHAFINYPDLQQLLFAAGFDKPSPIQAQAWPLIMSGFDTIGIAQTGTGKTLAFLLPAYAHILEQGKMPGKCPGANVLIMAPTRELAQQIHKEVEKFNYGGITSVCVYGGIERRKQLAEVRKGCNILIATPGRLDDFIMSGDIDITTVTYVVLDEADRMLDCGFEPQIRKTMYKIRPDRQTIMTSATWPSAVQRLANSYMAQPMQVVVGTLDLSAVNSVEQEFVFMENEPEVKLEYLLDFIECHKHMDDLKVMVFATSKATAAFVSSEISLRQISCSSIRGDMGQEEREWAIQAIKDGEVKFIVATDVASRGIDIPDLTHVINFDFPRDIEEYVHRVGRTGRAGKTGKSLTYFTRRDNKHAEELIKILEKADQVVPEELTYAVRDNQRRRERYGDKPRGGHRRYNNNFNDHF